MVRYHYILSPGNQGALSTWAVRMLRHGLIAFILWELGIIFVTVITHPVIWSNSDKLHLYL